jgi:hypothetical protein
MHEQPRPPEAPAAGSYRYGVVLGLNAITLVFIIIAPNADWARATVLALQGSALVVAIATTRARAEVRRTRAVVACVVAALLVVVVAAGTLSIGTESAIGALIALAIPGALIGGLISLTRKRGVTLQAVAGALAIYLQLGLVFAWVVSLVAHFDPDPYFTQGGDGTQAIRVYFSFTVMTTTGFGDYTPAGSVGRALAVVEMLAGQLYLVTVIGVLVGGLVGRRNR